MSTYVALFRGINVGGNNLLPMKALVSILEDVGCEEVRTYIQSGNAVFRTKGKSTKHLAEQIGAAVRKGHGFTPQVLLLSASELAAAIEGNPYPTEDGKALHFFFLQSTPANPDTASLDALRAGSEAFTLAGRVLYLFTPDGLGRSKLAAKVEGVLGVPATARNWNTVNKLAEMTRHTS